MPRLPPSLFWKAKGISPHAASLLPACRDLPSALTELRWIREHIRSAPSPIPPALRLWQLCSKRGSGVPLQYVLGSQPFGRLDILCRPGVLIPRPEPEAYTTHLARLLTSNFFGPPSRSLDVIDLCTGTGCIALLLSHLLQPSLPSLRVLGVDISPRAVSLARRNARHNSVSARFDVGDIFAWTPPPGWRCDVLVSNPPYVSERDFARATARAVRNYEPRLAQVPEVRPPRDGPVREDVFYERLLDIGKEFRPRVMLYEVGGIEQAERVVSMVRKRGYRDAGYEVEIWRDGPDAVPEHGEAKEAVVDGERVGIHGSGHGRSVLIYQKNRAIKRLLGDASLY